MSNVLLGFLLSTFLFGIILGMLIGIGIKRNVIKAGKEALSKGRKEDE
jgi:hypothetical protein